eukprot:6204669-Pleurochrysis_carterae.AAC.1
MGCPTPALLDAALRVLAYLHHHKHIGLRYELCPDPNVHGHTDSDCAIRHSTSGWVFMHCSAAISWSSKKQATVALSSCEVEIVAASQATKKAVYLAELGLPQRRPASLSMDNKCAIDLAYNPEHHKRTKHIDRRHFFVREKVESHDFTVP